VGAVDVTDSDNGPGKGVRGASAMILVHAGNRVDSPDHSGPPRFQEVQVAFVQRRLARFVDALRPRVVVSAAAAGADLLLLESALATPGVAVHVVLPFAASWFRETSVADRGALWTERYDRVLSIVRERTGCDLIEFGEAPDDAGYRAGNRHLIDHAAGIADSDGVLALAVRPPSGHGAPSMTDDFVEAARLREITVIDVDPGILEREMRKAFVAMPFGEKIYKRRKVDCDATFAKVIVPVLEDADLAWEREDRRLDVGIIHIGMIEQLGNADIVVVDTIAANPNVFYELGMRHAFADKTTVLLGPRGTTPPFDTRPIRHFTYTLSGTAITDQEALEAITRLRQVFDHDRLAAAGRDSPVFEFFDVATAQTAPGRLRLRGAINEPPRVLVDLHRRVSDAADRGDIEDLEQLAGEIPAQPLDQGERAQLLLIIGMALREHGQPTRAVQILRPLRYDPADGRYELWAQQLAMALRRQGEGLARTGGDPEPLWQEAERLLNTALAIDKDPETCGIAGGLAKQRGIRELRHGRPDLARAHLQRAADLYREGAEAEPANFYAGLNAVTTMRILTQHLDGQAELLERAQELLPVVMYFARNAVKRDANDFWPVVSVAELVLTAHLLGGNESAEDAIRAYARAATMRTRPDHLTSVVNQLELYRRVGDPAELIDRIQALFERK
jgi:tetratricopeptide (TPR) repeat protein